MWRSLALLAHLTLAPPLTDADICADDVSCEYDATEDCDETWEYQPGDVCYVPPEADCEP